MVRPLQRVLLLAAGFAVAGVVLEVGYRVVLAVQGESRSAAERRAAYVSQLDWLVRPHGRIAFGVAGAETPDEDELVPAVRGTVLSPYLGVDRGELLEQYVPVADYFATEEAERTFDVVVLGGSVAGLLTTHEGASEVIAETLASDPRLDGRPVRVHGQGRGGFKAPQTLVLAELLFQLGWKPDLVVLLDGFNEVALANENLRMGGHPLYPSIRNWSHLTPSFELTAADVEWLVRLHDARDDARALVVGGLRLGVHQSALCSRLFDAILARPMSRHAAEMQRMNSSEATGELPVALRGPVPPSSSEDAVARMVDIWAESSTSLAASCAARGIAYVHVLQPTLYDEGAKPISDFEARVAKISPEWREGVTLGYPKLRERGAQLVVEDVPFHDASRMFESWTGDLYYDACHVVPEGSREIARFIAEAALASDSLVGEGR